MLYINKNKKAVSRFVAVSGHLPIFLLISFFALESFSIPLLFAQSVVPITYEVLDNTISSSKIQSSGVTSSKIAPKAITYDKIDTTGAQDGYVLKYSASSGKFMAAPEAGATNNTGVTAITLGKGFVNQGSIITSSGTLNVNTGSGAGQVLALDSNGNLFLENTLYLNYSPNQKGHLSLRDSVSASDFRFYTDGSLKLIYTDDYVLNSDTGHYDLAAEFKDDGNITFFGNFSVGGNLEVNAGTAGNNYTFPSSRGTANQYLATDGAGGTSWVSLPATGLGTVTNVTSGTGLTGGPITTTGSLAVNSGTAVGQIAVVQANGKIHNTNIPNGINAALIGPNTTGANVISNTEFAYLNGVTSPIQTQFSTVATTYQPLNANLTSFAAITPTNNYTVVGNGASWIAASPSSARTALGLGTIATQNSNNVNITGGTIDNATIGGTTPAAIYATTLTASGTITATTLSATNITSNGYIRADGNITGDYDGNKAVIGTHPTYGSFAAFYREGNSHYTVLANATNTYLNANSATGNVYLRADNSDILVADGSSGDVTISRGDLNVGTGGGSSRLIVRGSMIMNGSDFWIRTYGNTGWYNGDHQGGWRMTDNTSVRSYNDKDVYTGGVFRADEANIGEAPSHPGFYGFWKQGSDYSFLTNGSNTYVNAPSSSGSIFFRFNNDNSPSAMELTVADGLELNVGTAYKSGGGAWTATSDIRLKDVVSDYTHGLAEIRQINPVSYRYKKGNEKGLPSDKTYIGVVAQDMQPIIPESVTQGRDGFLLFQSDPVWWAGINAVKEIDAMVSVQKEGIQELLNSQGQRRAELLKLETQQKLLLEEHNRLNSETEGLKKALCEIKKHLKLCQKRGPAQK